MNKALLVLIKSTVFATGLAIISTSFNAAHAVTFNFSCDGSINPNDCAGNEGGSLDVTSVLDSGNYLYTVDVNNTSGAAAITGFGFDFDPDFDLSLLVANSLSVIRADGTDISSRWALSAGTQSVSNGSSFDNISLSFIDFDGADTGGPGGINASGIFNTTGIDATIQFRFTEDLSAQGGLLRLQRTGTAGGGSLKLVDTNGDTPDPDPVTTPEPGTAGAMALLALGAFASLNVTTRNGRVTKER